MSDFRLQVFYKVASRLSFTKAANELFITQPAVTKHIHELEAQYQTKLFERAGNNIKLTPAGKLLLQHTEALFGIYRNIDFEMHALNNNHQGLLRLGASTTLSNYIIPPLLAVFRQKYPKVNVELINGNTEQIENALLKKDIELGIIEGRSKNQAIRYLQFLKDEIVLVCNNSKSLIRQQGISVNDLKTIPLLMREAGSGTQEVIEHALKKHQLKLADLKVEMRLGSTESIKSYLLHAPCMAFVSIHSVLNELKNAELQVVDIKDFEIERTFHFIHLQGKAEALPEVFMLHAQQHYNLR